MRQIHTFIVTAEARKILDTSNGEGGYVCELFHPSDFAGFVRSRPVEMTINSDGAVCAKFEIETKD